MSRRSNPSGDVISNGAKFLLSLDSPYVYIRKHRALGFIIVALLMLLTARNTLSYRPSVNVDSLSYISEETRQAKGAYLQAFGSPDSNLFYLEGMDFLSAQGINFLYRLQQDVRAAIPYLREVNSLINLFPPGTQLPLQAGSPEAQRHQEWIRRRALSSPATSGHLVSEDGQKALVVMDFEALPSERELREQGKAIESPYISIGRAMEQILRRYQQPRWSEQGLQIWGSGAAHIVYQQSAFYVSDLSQIFILLTLIMLILIFLMLRSWLSFLGTLFSSVVANWLTIGFLSWMEMSVDLTFVMIPVTIGVATAIGYSVHFYNHFKHSLQHTSVDTALSIAWLRCVRPITFTALTTMFSFLSLHLVPIPAIQNTGYACLLEVLIIYVFTMTLYPLLLSFTNFRAKYHNVLQHGKWAFSVQLDRLAQFSFRHRKTIIFSAGGLFLTALFYTMKLQVNYKFSEFMGPENQVVKDLEYLKQSDFAPVGTISLVIYNEAGLFGPTSEKNQLDMLHSLQHILDQIQDEKIIKRVFWLGDLVQDAAKLRGQAGGITSLSRVSQLNGLLLLSKRLSGFDAANWIAADRKSLRILLEVKAFESLPLVNLAATYRQQLQEAANTGNAGSDSARVFFTGFIMDTSRGDLLMTRSFIKSIIVSLLIVFFLLLIIFRRLYITLIAMIPNVFPLIMIGGIISFMGISLNSFNFLIFPMVIGLIVDDTIHFFYTMVSRFDSSKNYRASIHATLAQVGPALVETTIILCSSFIVFVFSKFQGLAHMGLFTVLVILMALLADLILGPICLSLLSTENLKYKPLRRFVFWGPVVEKQKLSRMNAPRQGKPN